MGNRERERNIANALLGDLLDVRINSETSDVDRSIVAVHLADIAMLPHSLVSRVRAAGLAGVIVGPGRVTDLLDFPHAIDQARLLRSPGVYDRTRAVIVMGTIGRAPHTAHNLLHEFGHAAGHLLGLNDHPALIAHHSNPEVWMRLPVFFRGIRPGDETGRSELLAEAVRERILVGTSMSRRYGQAFVRWLEEELEFR
jgi:hypothetical protein